MTTNPWDQRSDEPSKAYELFAVYLNAGPTRSFAATARLTGHSNSNLRRYSTQFDWKNRAEAHDRDALGRLVERRSGEREEEQMDQLRSFAEETMLRAERLGDASDKLLTLATKSMQRMLDHDEVLDRCVADQVGSELLDPLRGSDQRFHLGPLALELLLVLDLFPLGGLLEVRQAAVAFLKHDEEAEQVEKTARLQHALQQHLELAEVGRGVAFPRHGAPGLEPLAAGTDGADPGLDAVGGDQYGVGGEQRRDLGLVGLQLLEGAPDRGVLVGGVLELDHCQR